jgi:hypothetical protein
MVVDHFEQVDHTADLKLTSVKQVIDPSEFKRRMGRDDLRDSANE